jgi:tRNA threonylcarbamoyladenosine biosynthesis protein TsaB
MKILALDTATEACSAAVLTDGALVARYVEVERGHGDRILPMVHEVLGEAGLRLGDLDAVAFGRGPGGFTGVRLAASVAQGLAFGASIRVVPISNLRAVAQLALDLYPDACTILVCNDARMQEVYTAVYGRDSMGLATLAGTERVIKPVEVPEPTGSVPPVHGAGHGFRAYPVLRDRLQPSLQAVHDSLLPRAHEIARLAAVEVAAGRTLPPEQALPVYVRDNVARPASRD